MPCYFIFSKLEKNSTKSFFCLGGEKLNFSRFDGSFPTSRHLSPISCSLPSPFLQYLLPLLETVCYGNGFCCPQDLPKDLVSLGFLAQGPFSLLIKEGVSHFPPATFHPVTLREHAKLSFLNVRNDILFTVSFSFHCLLNTFMSWQHPLQPHMLFTGKRFFL